MNIDIIQIGNSKGIRIPKSILNQCGIDDSVELEVDGEQIILSPMRQPRVGWQQKIEAALKKGYNPCDESEDFEAWSIRFENSFDSESY